MVKLFCAIIGEEGSTFPVDIDKGQTVGGLKKKIKEENEDDPTLKTVAAKNLQLFLTKTESDRWLSSNDSVVIAMRKGDVPEQVKKLLIKEMDPAEEIGDIFGAAPTKNVVHVLVVVPAVSAVLPNVLLIGVNEGYAALISSYMEIAGRLKENKKVRSLSNYLARVVAKVKDDDEAPPFFVLENSSGTGKTQMAFNLIARGECDVFYIVCGDLGDREQPVYNAYATRTGTFQECVNQDLEAMQKRTLQKHVPLGSIGQIRSMQTLSLYGFILAALQGKDRFYGPKERSHVFDELRRRQESRMKPFVFFLDEFPRAGKHLTDNAQQKLKNSLRMMRNVFRSFGLAVVMSSTNGTARNLVVTSSRSRQDGPQLWCRVFPCFPDAIVKDDPNVPELLMEILRHSRPLFAQIALKYMQENPYIHGCDFTNYLNAMVKTLASRISCLKKRTKEFETGQLCLLLCTSYCIMDDQVNIIDGHFARLVEQTAFTLQLDSQGLRKDDESWKFRCVLPPPEEDILLHLTMTGGLLFRPFEESLCAVMSKNKPIIHYGNPEQRSNDGQFLEALTAAAIVLASHAGGIGGVGFPRFLCEFLFELGVSERSETVKLYQDVENAGWTQIVPFLSPPNGKWPTWLNDNSMLFDNLVRTENKECIDFRATSNIISGECKDYSSAINLSVVTSILERVPADSKIHLVVTNTLQQEYFTELSSWDTFVSEHKNLLNRNFYRVSKGSGLQKITGMTNRSSTATDKKLVLFIELKPGQRS